MARLTALRRARAGHVLLEVDGKPWRTVPDEVVARCGLSAGVSVDRPLLRRLRTELLRAEALATAGRALARRDLSVRRLDERLRRRGLPPAHARAAVGALESVRIVDDVRVARSRAAVLCERGLGDEAILARLEQEGLAPDLAREAVEELPPELERAVRLAEGAGTPRNAANLLLRRGFSPDAVEAVVGALDEEPWPALG